MVHPVMRRCKNNMIQEAKTPVLQYIFTNMNKCTPESIDKHDQEQEWRIYAQQDANGSPDEIRIRRFQKKMSKRNRKIHGLRRMMRRMQAPQKSYLMSKVVIDEMG